MICTVELTGDPLVDALQPGSEDVEFAIEEGLLTVVSFPDYRLLDLRFRLFVEGEDRDGLEAACTLETDVYNRECAEFLAQFVDAYIAEASG